MLTMNLTVDLRETNRGALSDVTVAVPQLTRKTPDHYEPPTNGYGHASWYDLPMDSLVFRLNVTNTGHETRTIERAFPGESGEGKLLREAVWRDGEWSGIPDARALWDQFGPS